MTNNLTCICKGPFACNVTWTTKGWCQGIMSCLQLYDNSGFCSMKNIFVVRPKKLLQVVTSWDSFTHKKTNITYNLFNTVSVQFSSVTQSCLILCDPMNPSMPGLPVHHQLPEFTQTHVHWVGDAIQPSHPLSSPSPPAPNPSQHQSLFQWINSLHEVAKVLEFQLQHHSLQRNPRADLL